MKLRVRDATSEDWPRIWPFFSAIARAGETFTYDTRIGEADARALWMVEPPGRTTVAVDDDGTVLGSASMYANRPGPGSHIASGSFMVDPARQGMGVGRALCEDLIAWSGAQGFRGIQFNAVAESNVGAVGLYRSLGFEVIGTVPGAFRHPTEGYVGLHVMYRPLASDSSP